MKRLPPKKAEKIVWALFIVGAIAGLLGVWLDRTSVVIAGCAVIFLALLFHFVFYRCPHCRKFLDRSTGEFCPYCGKRVDE